MAIHQVIVDKPSGMQEGDDFHIQVYEDATIHSVGGPKDGPIWIYYDSCVNDLLAGPATGWCAIRWVDGQGWQAERLQRGGT